MDLLELQDRVGERIAKRLGVEAALVTTGAAGGILLGTAAALTYRDRGLIRVGYAADLVIFDPAKVQDKATYQNPHQFSEGFDYVVVNGTVMVDDGKLTEARAGRVLRR